MTDNKAEAERVHDALPAYDKDERWHMMDKKERVERIAAALGAAEKRALMDLAEHFDGCGMTLAAAMTRVRAEEVERS